MADDGIVLSDTHFGHRKVAELRGFDSTNEHDLTIVRNINKMVTRPDMDVFLLGDTIMGNREHGMEMLALIQGRVHIILGNHDREHPLNPNGHNHQTLGSVAYSVSMVGKIASKKGVKVLMSHFPYEGDHTDKDRFDQWRLRDMGVPLLHGHTHGKEQVTFTSKGTMQIHVGLDAWDLCPVRLSQVFRIIANHK